jgi:hypothetical protein
MSYVLGTEPPRVFKTYQTANNVAAAIHAETGVFVSISHQPDPPMSHAPLGPVTEGTLRQEDLYEAYVSTLAALDPDRAKAFEMDLGRVLFEVEPDELLEARDELLVQLSDILDEYAPPLCYFGSSEGDGASIGYFVGPECVAQAEENPEEYAVVSDRTRGGYHVAGQGVVLDPEFSIHDLPHPYVLFIDERGDPTLYGPAEPYRSIIW